jgi:hypothetical protein
MKHRSPPPPLPRGRVATWDREKLETLTTLELRQLLVNAEQRNEPAIAAICGELLDARPHGRPPAPRQRRKAVAAAEE